MKQYVIDTNLFFNMGSGLGYGTKTEGVVKAVTTEARKAKKDVVLITSPRIVEEFLSFFDDKNQSFIVEFLSVLEVKTPDAAHLSLSATVCYELVSDIRERSYRGLRIGEEEIEAAGRAFMGTQKLQAQEFQKKTGEFIRGFRDRYRNATRTGFLDSLGDLDLILLAKEQDAHLVSADEGVVRWGRIFGVKEVTPEVFGIHLKQAANLHRE